MERTEVQVYELLRLPLPFPEDLPDPERARKLLHRIDTLASKARENIRRLHHNNKDEFLHRETLEDRRAQLVDELQSAVEPLLYDYFGLNKEEIALIEDTCTIFKPSATPTSMRADIPTLETASKDDLNRFSAVLADSLNGRSRDERKSADKAPPFFVADYGRLNDEGLAVVTLRRGSNTEKRNAAEEFTAPECRAALGRLLLASGSKIGPFECQRGVVHSTPEAIYIIRQDRLVYWTRTSALNTADAIYGAIKTSRLD